jgi:uncharacterized protein (TIGR03000 family)
LAGVPRQGDSRRPDVWSVVDGALVCSPKNGKRGGYLVTNERYGSFELAFDWKVSVGGDSGVLYRVSESEDSPLKTGPEYQIVDNTARAFKQEPKTAAAACCWVFAPSADRSLPVGEWNHGRIVVDGQHVEHWLNGDKVVEYDFNSDRWRRHVSESRMKDMPKFGEERRGHVALQYIGSEVWFRSIRVRRLHDERIEPPDAKQSVVPDGVSAVVIVRCHPDAELWFDGAQTTQTGPERTFSTPELQPDKEYKYRVKVRWTHEGRAREFARTVPVIPGKTVEADLTPSTLLGGR